MNLEQKPKTVKDLFNEPAISNRISEILKKNAPQFVSSVIEIVSSSNELAECSPISIVNSAIVSATLDLPLNNALGLAFIVPYDNKIKGNGGAPDRWEKVAQFQIGYKGFRLLAQRTNRFVTINETDVRAGEILHRDRLTGDFSFNWIQDDKIRNEAEIVGYLSHIVLTNGFKSTLFMSVEELEEHARKYSKVYKTDGSGGGKWKTDRPAMARKTVVKLNLNRNAIISIVDQSLTLQNAIQADQSLIEGFDADGKPIYNYLDNDNNFKEYELIADSPAVKAKKAEDAMLAKLNLK